ncbi:hypothetical protein PBRA_005235 [Plasmodiophora brassicae]|uniref:Uncharacterized protein n=1 Tax=Plasmodiophora brassicae TaxID=37360 RepID=A0A0G4IN30_PLABS|nr:hypothetical protein PBRA_005235 [Plasmodiophora brassicae]
MAIGLRCRDLDLAVVNGSLDIAGRLSVNSASDREASAQDLLNGALQLLRLRPRTHRTSNVENRLERQVSIVLDVLLLLAITDWLLESANDERRRRRDDLDLSLTVLDSQLAGDTETLVLSGRLRNVLTNFLW